ncbi:hypothetical protein EYC59_03115 [Candidatus Saccharibacteria bacterium]|nr:MAG: hypothetical protein EYC59_03115 [Candidatus Saccharibacteria bacterium]
MPETLSAPNQTPPPGEYPHHMEGQVTAAQVSAHLAENPTMYHPGLDPHMEANGIVVDRSAELSPIDVLEGEAVTKAEASTAHNWGEIASMPRTEEHVREHETVGRKLDQWYGERTSEEQTAISVIGELGAEAETASGVTQESAEVIANPSLTQELAQLPEKLQPRITEALEASDFAPTPEVKEAITGYYTDHYKLATVIDKALDGKITPEDAAQMSQEPLADTFAVDQAMRGILESSTDTSRREEVLRDADKLIRGMLFQECAIGATTQTEQEAQIASDLSVKLIERAVDEGFATTPKDGSFSYWNRQGGGSLPQPSEVADRVRTFGDRFWKDSRHAGQLLFHNTSNFKDVALSGYRLMSRTQQLEETGTFYAQMAINLSPGQNMHSNAPHWSENYDPTGYKIPKNNATPGTLAVPMAEVIKTAPYARNAHYGTVVLKEGHEGVIDKVTVNDTIHSIGVGSADSQGASGLDRVFAADYRASQASEAYKYAIDPGSKALQIFTTGEERVYYEGSDTYGIGENFPAKRILEYNYGGTADPLYDRPNQDLAAREAMKASLNEQIRTLQRQSRQNEKYVGRYVVPLRQGVMEFVAEDGISNDIFARSQKQITHSSISAETARAAEARKRAA